jgi:hypothetical protein
VGLYTPEFAAYVVRVTNVRWWSAALVFAADETGNPVRIRDGPAAVTEQIVKLSVDAIIRRMDWSLQRPVRMGR